MKKFIIFLSIISLLLEVPLAASADVWRGHAEVSDTIPEKEKIFTGQKAKIESKSVIRMVVSQVLSGELTQEGDEFFAEVTSDVTGGDGILVPVGTLAHGTVRNIAGPGRGGRDGWIEVKFDSLITPDGREIPVQATMTTKNTPAKAIAKAIGKDTAYTVTGSLVGGYTMLNLFGLEAAVASHGYTILGGLAAGAVMGLAISLIRKGNGVLISRGDEIKVTIESDTELPVIHKDAFKREEVFYKGLDVRINDIWLVKDPFGLRNTFMLNLDIDNASDQNFTAFDIAVVSDLNKVYNPSLFFSDAMPFSKIKAGTNVKGKMYFSVDDPKRPHWLVFYSKTTRKPLAEISLDNVKQELHIDFSKKRKKLKKKE